MWVIVCVLYNLIYEDIIGIYVFWFEFFILGILVLFSLEKKKKEERNRLCVFVGRFECDLFL